MTGVVSELVCACGQAWWSFGAAGFCPACERRRAIEAVSVFGPDEDDVLWIERTAVTATIEAAGAFLADHLVARLVAEDGWFSGYIVEPSGLSGWAGPSWWKPGRAPFSEEDAWIAARPGEPTALALWSVWLGEALRPDDLVMPPLATGPEGT